MTTSDGNSLDVKITPARVSSKRIKRELHRSNTCPVPDTAEKEESKSGQRKSKRLRKSNVSSPPPSPVFVPELVEPKKELITTMKRHVPSTVNKDKDNINNPNQVVVKTDKRYYWCTKCAKVYLNLISLYTESHYRQCVGENQHFNVIQDAAFFANEDILRQLPSHLNNDANKSGPSIDAEDTSVNARRKETIFFSKNSDDAARTYFINGKPIRMSTINRPITVKDLRQQFNQQSSVASPHSSEEYLFQQQRSSPSKSSNTRSSRSTESHNWKNDSNVKVIPTPRSLDRFGISSDDEEEDDNDDDEEEETVESSKSKPEIKQPKPEIEKTLVKRRYDSEYTPSTNDADSHSQSKQYLSRKSQPAATERVRPQRE